MSRLSDRQLALLRQLHSLKFLTAVQVERLVYRPGRSALSAARTTRRDLAWLHDQGLLDRLSRRIGGTRAGSASFIYTLSDTGQRALGQTSRRRAREPSLSHLDHVLQVAELVTRLHEASWQGELELLDVQGEPDCWRQVLGPNAGKLTLKPDLRLTLGVAELELHWFVELDRGSEHRPVLTRKCQAYLSAYRDGREQAVAAVFPRVLWVVPDEDRAAALDRLISSLPAAPAGMFLTATFDTALAVLRGGEGES